MNTNLGEGAYEWQELCSLAPDLKRILRVQMKEFINSVEDVELENGILMTPEETRSMISRRMRTATNVA